MKNIRLFFIALLPFSQLLHGARAANVAYAKQDTGEVIQYGQVIGHDFCFSKGQPCRCRNNGKPGTCDNDSQKVGSRAEKELLYCHNCR